MLIRKIRSDPLVVFGQQNYLKEPSVEGVCWVCLTGFSSDILSKSIPVRLKHKHDKKF